MLGEETADETSRNKVYNVNHAKGFRFQLLLWPWFAKTTTTPMIQNFFSIKI
jgi:hypothetical protein